MTKRIFCFRFKTSKIFLQLPQSNFLLFHSALLVFLTFFGFVQSGHAKCINDYRIQQRKIPHTIPSKELEKLRALSRSGNLTAGWKIVSHWGDPYASLAAKVLSHGETMQDKFYQKLIATHWINTNGVKIYRTLFRATAQQHFKQYVELLHSGTWPDSDQIILSYLTAVRKNHLSDITVLDAAWDAAGFNRYRSWQSLNHFPAARTIYPTRVCMNVNKLEAQRVLAKDFLELPFELMFQL